ncbi:TetR/AcrR family transcriptional regulator C-terminal domain-containing protein [Aurantimonas sp. VKM B-3413]|uniref:TetR/AcrR family transcriptional regulator C-terminal domain-containing protein n=1 Tax=Aurantimonas sp. VKM B-3413 TaxID=2779401 RepID=UPI00351CF014|nr:TetR/AcrR family transcriptional regulator C-terminal domain-containing protein [Aurantimonas sp. VKM B-3413]
MAKARIIGGSYTAKSNILRMAEVIMGLRTEVGLSPDKAVWTMTSLLSFVLGETLEQQGLPEGPAEAVSPARAAISGALSDGEYRHLDTSVITQHFFDFDGRFEFGLMLLLNGIDTTVSAD